MFNDLNDAGDLMAAFERNICFRLLLGVPKSELR